MAKDKSKSASQIAVFAVDPETESAAQEVLKDLNLDGLVKRGGIDTAIEYLSSNPSPKLVVVDISSSDLPLSDVNALAEACEPGVEVIVLGQHNDIGLFRDLIKLGVTDYLAKPVTRELLRRSVESVRTGSHAPGTRGRTGKLVAVTGARGGVGATTICANLGWLLSQKVGRRVAMVDLDFNFGALSLALDQKATPGLREALENIHRVDQLFLERTIAHVNSRLALLSCEEPLEYQVRFETRAYDDLIGHLTKQYHYVVVDVPRTGNINFRHALKNASVRVIVLDPTLASVRHTIRMMKSIGAEEVSKQTILVLNRRWPQGDGDLSVEEMEKALGRRIDVVVPYGKTVPVIAENSGEMIASKNSPITEALTELVHELSGRGRVKASLFSRLIKNATRPFQGSSGSAPIKMEEPKVSRLPLEHLHGEGEQAPPLRKNGEQSFAETFGSGDGNDSH